MKTTNLIFLLAVVFLPAACSTVTPQTNVSGNWNWQCCGGEYSGKMELKQTRNGKLSGRFYDTSGGSGGKLVGHLGGHIIDFTRTWGEKNLQHYKLTLSSDGTSLNGEFEGNHIGGLGTEFKATRETQ